MAYNTIHQQQHKYAAVVSISFNVQLIINRCNKRSLILGGLLTIILTACLNILQAQDTWLQKSDLGANIPDAPNPSARIGAVAFSVNDKGYVGTGYDPNAGLMNDFWEYDPAANTWSQKADFAGNGRYYAVGFSVSGKGYLGTGDDGSDYKNDFWQYDPALNTWTQKADFGGTARFSAVGFNINDKGYIGTGGIGNFTYENDLWEYNPETDTWTQKADFMGTARRSAVGLSIGSKGYVGTGVSNDYFNDFWEYDPVTDSWIQKTDFGGNARKGAVGLSISNKGYIGTGYYFNFNQNYYNDFWEYDPWANTWLLKTNLPGNGREGAFAFSIANKIYIGTGEYNDDGLHYYFQDFWEYDTDANNWTGKAVFGSIGRSSATGFSIGVKGYIGTGIGFTYVDEEYAYYYKDFWEYDPVADAWTQKADFGGGNRFGAVGFSIGGKGYMGTGHNGGYMNDFWEYDPAANTWIQKASFGGIERTAAVGFSISNKGYIGTGFNNGGHQDFWEYDPVADNWTQKENYGGGDRSNAVGFSINNYGYIGTGQSGTAPFAHKDFWEYDPANNTWLQKSDFGGSGRSSAGGFSIGDKGYIGTGLDIFYDEISDFWEYDVAADAWTQRADFAGITRYGSTCFSVGNKGYLGTGGFYEGDYFEISNEDFWEYTQDSVVTANNQPPEFTDLFKVSPNPVTQYATISFCLNEASPVVIEMMDVNGRSLRVIAHKDFSAGSHEVTFNSESLVAGIYFLQMKTTNGIVLKKMIIE